MTTRRIKLGSLRNIRPQVTSQIRSFSAKQLPLKDFDEEDEDDFQPPKRGAAARTLRGILENKKLRKIKTF